MIERTATDPANNPTWVTIESNTGSTTTTYSDSEVSISETATNAIYYYRVSAINSGGTGTATDPVAVDLNTNLYTIPEQTGEIGRFLLRTGQLHNIGIIGKEVQQMEKLLKEVMYCLMV